MRLGDAVKANLDIAAVLNSAHSDEREEFTRLVATKGLDRPLARVPLPAQFSLCTGPFASVERQDIKIAATFHRCPTCLAGYGKTE